MRRLEGKEKSRVVGENVLDILILPSCAIYSLVLQIIISLRLKIISTHEVYKWCRPLKCRNGVLYTPRCANTAFLSRGVCISPTLKVQCVPVIIASVI